MSNCQPCREILNVGCFEVNDPNPPDGPRPCVDPCNRPTQPTLDCPAGGTPRFEHYDNVSGNLFTSPRCGETTNITVCGNNAQKYVVGQRITLILGRQALGSYLITDISSSGVITIKNTGNAPNGQSFPHYGTLKVIHGNHDGHWNDAECKERPIVNAGNIVVSRISDYDQGDCCAQQGAACHCEGEIQPGVGHLLGYQDGDVIRYGWDDDVMDRGLCNDRMPYSEAAHELIGKRDGEDGASCGVRIRPDAPHLIPQSTPDGEIRFLPLNVCPVPDAEEFNGETDAVVFCRDGETLKAPIEGWIRDNTTPPLCELPTREPTSDSEFAYCENGQFYKGRISTLWAGYNGFCNSQTGPTTISELRFNGTTFILPTIEVFLFELAAGTGPADYIVQAVATRRTTDTTGAFGTVVTDEAIVGEVSYSGGNIVVNFGNLYSFSGGGGGGTITVQTFNIQIQIHRIR